MASALYDKLMADMKDAMKAHNTQTVNAVRGVIAKVKDLTVNAGKEITDDVVLAVVAKGVKQREESIAQFESAGRAELAEGSLYIDTPAVYSAAPGLPAVQVFPVRNSRRSDSRSDPVWTADASRRESRCL